MRLSCFEIVLEYTPAECNSRSNINTTYTTTSLGSLLYSHFPLSSLTLPPIPEITPTLYNHADNTHNVYPCHVRTALLQCFPIPSDTSISPASYSFTKPPPFQSNRTTTLSISPHHPKQTQIQPSPQSLQTQISNFHQQKPTGGVESGKEGGGARIDERGGLRGIEAVEVVGQSSIELFAPVWGKVGSNCGLRIGR